MGSRRCSIPGLLVLQLAVAFLMFSCASSPPVNQLTVHLRKDFVGTVRIATCVAAAPAAEIYASAQGDGKTSLYPTPSEDVAVILMRGEQQLRAAPEDIAVPRTGDGIATSILVTVR